MIKECFFCGLPASPETYEWPQIFSLYHLCSSCINNKVYVAHGRPRLYLTSEDREKIRKEQEANWKSQ